MKKKFDKELFWIVLIIVLLVVVVLVSGFFYFSVAFASPTGHVIVNDKDVPDRNAEQSLQEETQNEMVDKLDFRYKVDN